MIRTLFFGFLAASLLASFPLRAADLPPKRSPDEVLLVVNGSSPISRAVGGDYAQRRSVTNVLTIRCADAAVKTENETVSLAVYRKEIEAPVRDYLSRHAGIDFIVLTKGVPIRITGADTGCRPDHSSPETPLSTSVDNHLASLDYDTLPDAKKIAITGSGATGLGWLNRYWNAREPFSHAKFGGYLVTRLDGYTEADAKALVDRALAAEQEVPPGKYLFDVQPGFGLGDKAKVPVALTGETIPAESAWGDYNAEMAKAHDFLQARNIPSELDLTPVFVGDRTGLMGYFSWGSNDAKFSAAAYASLTFAPGSIGDTAVSTSARTFLPTHGGQSLIVDLVAHGITAVKGDTDEPLLQSNAAPTILLDRYLSGYTMAESFYAADRLVGWQDIIVGDPLCAPYRAGK